MPRCCHQEGAQFYNQNTSLTTQTFYFPKTFLNKILTNNRHFLFFLKLSSLQKERRKWTMFSGERFFLNTTAREYRKVKSWTEDTEKVLLGDPVAWESTRNCFDPVWWRPPDIRSVLTLRYKCAKWCENVCVWQLFRMGKYVPVWPNEGNRHGK